MNGNFKVRALETHNDFFTKGDIFVFKNGITTWNSGSESLEYDNFLELIGRNSWVDYFEEIKEEGENKMEDLRELIKVCYVIKMRDEKYAFVGQATGGICFDWKDGASCMMLYDYNKNLCYCDDYPRYDVMEIYGYSKHPYASTNASIEGRPLIWKRTEISPTQLKLEELEKKQREIADEMEKLRKEL